MAPRSATSDGLDVALARPRTYAVFAVGDGTANRLVRIGPAGKIEATVLEDEFILAMACEADGRVFVVAGHHEDGVGSHTSVELIAFAHAPSRRSLQGVDRLRLAAS